MVHASVHNPVIAAVLLRLLPWMLKALAMLVGQALACMQKMQRSGVLEHFSAAMTAVSLRSQ
jgi:hypothetical protein